MRMPVDSHDNRDISLRARVFNRIREDILAGKYSAGDSLVEMKLAEELGVSRTPVREAVRRLELEGLVVSVPNKGVFVQGVSAQDIEDIYVIRSLVEGQAARWAALRIAEDELRQLEEIIALMGFYTDRLDFDHLARLDTDFHVTIYDACRSKVLRQTLSEFHQHVQKVRLHSLQVPYRAQQALGEHRSILEAIAAGDGDKASVLMAQHIRCALENLHLHPEVTRQERSKGEGKA